MTAHEGPVIARRDDYTVIDCERCGWAHLDPLPDEAELALMYERTYYQELNAGWLEKDRSEQAFWDLEHADKLADWRAILDCETGALLDVGCSGGLLLEYAAAQGWRVEGIEPSRSAVAEARAHGLTIHAGLYQDVELQPQSFDVVHCKLVAEHLPDPPSFLAWTAKLLRPGGVVTIHVPNDFNSLQLAARDVLGLEDWWVAPPFHLNYFTFASLEGLLSRCGFTPAGRDTTFPMEWFLLMGENYVERAELGASAHQRRMLLESRLEALGQRRALHRHLASEGSGREAIVHGRWGG
ncbi:MAG TPA: class I SAM-dependent methyltransferase [Solirubrobacteraceae bacterium]|nr:class I SAM-dependent methyltransferase [Solirubrobacteraceae bacterium]